MSVKIEREGINLRIRLEGVRHRYYASNAAEAAAAVLHYYGGFGRTDCSKIPGVKCPLCAAARAEEARRSS